MFGNLNKGKSSAFRSLYGLSEGIDWTLGWRYDQLLPLHHLWLGYMSELLGLPNAPETLPHPSAISASLPQSSSMHPKLLKADFHGSILTVKASKNPALLNLSGILIHETENAFKLLTKESKIKRTLSLHPSSPRRR